MVWIGKNTTVTEAQSEHIGRSDVALSLLLGLATWLGLTVWSYPELPPELWTEANIAAGIRPATSLVPGFSLALASILHALFGIGGLVPALAQVGHLALAVVAVCSYAVFREMLSLIMRLTPQFSQRRRMVSQLAAVLGTVAFVVSAPVWESGQFFCESMSHLLLAILATESFFLFLRKGLVRYAYVSSLLLGLLAAESPIGLLLPMVFIGLAVFAMQVVPATEASFFQPVALEIGKWHMTFLYLAGLIFGVLINCHTFACHNGLIASGLTVGSLPIEYLVAYGNTFVNAANLTTWILLLGVCVCPFLAAIVNFPAAADEERFLHYAPGMVLFVCGAFAVAQASPIPSFWFWTYFPVDSRFLLQIGLFLSAFTLASAFAIYGVDALCRDHVRLAQALLNEAGEETAAPESRSTTIVRRVAFLTIPLFLLAILLPSRTQTATRQMLSAIADAARMTVDEAGDSNWLFTDGSLDAAIEFEAARRHRPLRCISLADDDTRVGSPIVNDSRLDAEDRFAFRYDAGAGLRSWIRDKPQRIKASAIQDGFILWRRDGKDLPQAGGLLLLPRGYSGEDAQARAIEDAHVLSERLLAIYARRGGIRMCSNLRIRQAFVSLQRILARLAEARADAFDRLGQVQKAEREARLADLLDGKNSQHGAQLEDEERRQTALLQNLSPREGLSLALCRGDSRTACVYAEVILAADPENPDANYALGMKHLADGQLSRAESYLTRCLLRRSDDARVHAALTQCRTRRKRGEGTTR